MRRKVVLLGMWLLLCALCIASCGESKGGREIRVVRWVCEGEEEGKASFEMKLSRKATSTNFEVVYLEFFAPSTKTDQGFAWGPRVCPADSEIKGIEIEIPVEPNWCRVTIWIEPGDYVLCWGGLSCKDVVISVEGLELPLIVV